jgi:hypothetical protein
MILIGHLLYERCDLVPIFWSVAEVRHVPELSPRRVLCAVEASSGKAGGDVRGVPGAVAEAESGTGTESESARNENFHVMFFLLYASVNNPSVGRCFLDLIPCMLRRRRSGAERSSSSVLAAGSSPDQSSR